MRTEPKQNHKNLIILNESVFNKKWCIFFPPRPLLESVKGELPEGPFDAEDVRVGLRLARPLLLVGPQLALLQEELAPTLELRPDPVHVVLHLAVGAAVLLRKDLGADVFVELPKLALGVDLGVGGWRMRKDGTSNGDKVVFTVQVMERNKLLLSLLFFLRRCSSFLGTQSCRVTEVRV